MAPGSYVLEVLGDRYPPTSYPVTIASGQAQALNVVTKPVETGWRGFRLVPGVIVSFALTLLAFRHYNIVQTNREMLRAQLENIATRIPLESDSAHRAEANNITERVLAIRRRVDDQLTWREWFFWSRGREIGAWRRLHEVERQLVAFLVPEARVIERAVTAEAELRTLTAPAAIALADRMHITLQPILSASASVPVEPHLLEHVKQQLAEALTTLYNDHDNQFAALMEWHNKAMWMVYLSLLVIAVVSWSLGHEVLFLVGGAGGLMSRMTRSLNRADVPSDYGASWTTLFLSPLVGALAAWFGVALIVWLRQMGVLGDALFSQIQWNGAVDGVLIGTAFALGFSERLFTSLLSAVEGKVTTSLTKEQTTPVSRPPLPTASANGAEAAASSSTTATTSAAASRLNLLFAELDAKAGERAAFIGDAQSLVRPLLVNALGAEQVVDVTAADLGARGPFDAVLFETPPTVVELNAAAAQLPTALRPDGRIVVCGRTPAALFEADAGTLQSQNQLGPALVKEVLVNISGLTAQEPPTQTGGTNEIDWFVGFAMAAPGGSDR